MFPSPQRVAVFLNVTTSDNLTQEQIDRRFEKVEKFADEMYGWLMNFYHNDPDITVKEPLVGIVYDVAGDPRRPGYGAEQVQQFLEENPNSGSFTHYHICDGKRTSSIPNNAGGYGTIQSSMSFEVLGMYALTSAMHEAVGHGQGVGHMGAFTASGEVFEYGGYGISDNTSSGLPGSAVYDARRLLPEGAMMELGYGDSAALMLYPIEAHPLEIGNHHQLLKLIDDEGNRFYVSLRRNGVPYNNGAGLSLLVECRYRRPPTPGATQWIYLGKINPGETRAVGQFYVTYQEEHKNRASITVMSPNSGTSSKLNTPTETFETPSGSTSLRREHTGLWKHDDFTGQGFDLFINEEEDYCVMGWYTYDSDKNQPRWIVLQGPVEDGVARLQGYNSDGSQLYGLGEARLDFLDTGKLFFQWNFGFTRASMLLDRLGPEVEYESGYTGWWSNPQEEYRGLKVVSFDDRYIAYWFGYGPGDIPSNPFIRPDLMSVQRWLMIDGSTLTGEGTTYQTSGRFMRPRFEIEEVGSAKIYRDGEELVYETHDGAVKRLSKLFG